MQTCGYFSTLLSIERWGEPSFLSHQVLDTESKGLGYLNSALSHQLLSAGERPAGLTRQTACVPGETRLYTPTTECDGVESLKTDCSMQMRACGSSLLSRDSRLLFYLSCMILLAAVVRLIL